MFGVNTFYFHIWKFCFASPFPWMTPVLCKKRVSCKAENKTKYFSANSFSFMEGDHPSRIVLGTKTLHHLVLSQLPTALL